MVVFVALSVLSRGALASASAVKTRTRTSTTATSPARYEKRARSETAVLAPAVDDRRRSGSWTRRVDKALFDATSISTVSEGWRELVRKLDSRERLSIVALGSSVMGVHGGCTSTARPLRHMCEVVGKRDVCCGAGMYAPPSEAREWLRPAIDWLEETYPVDLSKVEPLYNNPNVSHEWINIARPGGGIHSFASCLDKWLPDSENVDLFIFEFSATLELMDEGSVAEVHLARLTHELETIMHQLTQRKQIIEGSEEKRNMPAFMIVHAQNWCSPRFAKVSSGDSFAATRQLCRELPDSLIFKGYNLDVPRKEAMKSAIRDAYTRYHPVLDVYERLSEHYGIPVVNLRRGMFDVMRDSTQDESAPFALLDWTRDGLHPTQPNATRIVGSYFVNGLRMAIDATRLAYADEGGQTAQRRVFAMATVSNSHRPSASSAHTRPRNRRPDSRPITTPSSHPKAAIRLSTLSSPRLHFAPREVPPRRCFAVSRARAPPRARDARRRRRRRRRRPRVSPRPPSRARRRRVPGTPRRARPRNLPSFTSLAASPRRRGSRTARTKRRNSRPRTRSR